MSKLSLWPPGDAVVDPAATFEDAKASAASDVVLWRLPDDAAGDPSFRMLALLYLFERFLMNSLTKVWPKL